MRSLHDLVRNLFQDPLKALTWGLVAAVILLPVMGSVIWGMYEAMSRIAGHEFRLQRLCGTISYLNEALTMSARMAAATGDSGWEKRYRAVDADLDSAIVEVAMLARTEYERNYAAQTKLAYTKLIETESVALALVRQGRSKEASALLFSEDYDRYKALYSRGISEMTAAVQSRITGEIEGFRARILGTGLLALASLSLLVFAWAGVSMVVKTHLKRRKQAEEALAHERERLFVTLHSIGDGVISTDTSGRTNLMNRVAEELTGWKEEDAIGRPIEEVFVVINEKTRKSAENPVVKVLATGAVCGLANHTLLIARDGTERSIADSGAPIWGTEGKVRGVVLVFRDITEQEHMLREAAKAEKLESVGLLAGGIAHDFNNILAGILGNVSLAKLSIAPGSEEFRYLSSAEKAVDRATDLTQRLVTFAKGGAPIRKTASLGQLLAEWTEFALTGSHTRCEFRIQPDLWDAEVDEGQISQVIHNLVVNADQAMPDGGRIYLAAENHVQEGGSSLPLALGKYVRVSLKDEGVGVQPQHLQKIFDPYFTTKKTGRGLGLATSYAVVKRHGGHVTVRSLVGEGTIFEVFLPASEHPAPSETEVCDAPQNGKGRVLLMDDEETVRNVAGRMLVRLGYEVSVSRDGSEAIDLYRQAKEKGEPFDAVIMDLTIPGGLGGKEAVMHLRDLDPQIRAIVSSGYCIDPIMGDFKRYGFSGVLAKPYSTSEMGAVLHRVIAGERLPHASCQENDVRLRAEG